MIQVTDEYLAKFKKLCDDKGITYETEAEYRDAAYNLINLFDVLLDMSKEHLGWEKRLEKEPGGFALPSEGRSCSLCHNSVYGEVWYDKWGMKCMNCHEAFKKKIIPGYVFKDHENDKHITLSALSHRYDIHIQTLRKLVRQGDIKVRKVPHGPEVILRKENPNLVDVLEANQKAA